MSRVAASSASCAASVVPPPTAIARAYLRALSLAWVHARAARPALRRPAPLRDQLVSACPRAARPRPVGRLPPGALADIRARDRDVGDHRRRRGAHLLDPVAAEA